jgi:hypothetical protein
MPTIFVVFVQWEHRTFEDFNVLGRRKIALDQNKVTDPIRMDGAPDIDLDAFETMGLARLDRVDGKNTLSAAPPAPTPPGTSFELNLTLIGVDHDSTCEDLRDGPFFEFIIHLLALEDVGGLQGGFDALDMSR